MITQESLSRKIKYLGFDQYVGHWWTIRQRLFKVHISDGIKDMAIDWCEEHFGDEWIFSSPVQTDYTELYFVGSEDALMFKLTFATT
jgi:hypothetical protein